MRSLVSAIPVAVASLLAVGRAQLIQDTPYPEIIPLRQPYEAVWSQSELPSAWRELSCSNVSTTVLAFNCDRDFNPCALTICEDKGGESISIVDPVGGTVFETALPNKNGPSSLVYYGNGNPLANSAMAMAVDGESIYALNCDGSSSKPTCTFTALATHSVGPVVNDFTVFIAGKNSDNYCWVTGSNGTQAILIPGDNTAPYAIYTDAASYNAIAFSTAQQIMALGNNSMLMVLDASAPFSRSTAPPAGAASFPIVHWHWVTNLTESWGAEIDDVITALAFDDNACHPHNRAAVAANQNDNFDLSSIACVSGNGTLYIGNPTALNVLYPDGTIIRVDGTGGLPYTNITSIAVSSAGFSYASPDNAVSRPIYIGTTAGVIILDPFGTQDVKGQAYSQWVTPFGFGFGFNPAAALTDEVNEDEGNKKASTKKNHRKAKAGRKLRSKVVASVDEASAVAGAQIEYQPLWRYLNGPRWIPSSPDDRTNSNVKAKGITVLPAIAAGALHTPVGRNQELTLGFPSTADVAFVATQYGFTTLQMQSWKLADKATVMDALLPPHLYRGGQVDDCNYSGWGQANTCMWSPGANDGLWSSLVAAGESFRFAVTKDPKAAQLAWNVFLGMKSLGDVTGIRGLIARGAVGPDFKPTPTPGQNGWVKSNATGPAPGGGTYDGWYWICDASSDEVSGHEMAYGIIADLVAPFINATTGEVISEPSPATSTGHTNNSNNNTAVAMAADTLLRLAVYITANNFTLVDYTGLPTTWGHWEPSKMNYGRSWSDGRGINSMQILGLLTAALKYADPSSNDYALLLNGLQYLAVQNGYALNLINARINAPVDVNYSDHELSSFAALALLWNWRGANASSPAAGKLVSYVHDHAVLSFQRSFSTGLFRSRSDIFSLIYLYAVGAVQPITTSAGTTASATRVRGAPSAAVTLATAADVVWNMRTWAVEMTGWPSPNTQRVDVAIDPASDTPGSRDMNAGTVVLPHHERNQGRWNGDPFTLDGGDGASSEADPGVFLMPFWMSRYLGVLSA